MNCPNAFTALPDTCFDGNGLLLFKGIIISNKSHSFATAAEAGDLDNYKSAVLSGQLVPLHNAKEIEDLSGEDTNYESPSQEIIKLFEGKYRFKMKLYLTVEQHRIARTFSGKKANIYPYDRGGNIITTSPDGVIRKGLSVSFLNVEKLGLPTADQPAWTVFEFQLENTSEMNDQLAVVKPYIGTVANKWFPYNIPTITSVVMEQVTLAANVITVDVNYKSIYTTDNDGNPQSIVPIPAELENFSGVVGGVATAPTGVTPDATVDGRYAVTFTLFEATDTIQYVPQVADEDFYKSNILVATV